MTAPTGRCHAFADDALGDHDAVSLAGVLRSREVGVTEVVEAAIARTERIAGPVHPVQHKAYDEARVAASELDRRGLKRAPPGRAIRRRACWPVTRCARPSR